MPMEIIVPEVPNAGAFHKKALGVLEAAKVLEVTDNGQYEIAALFLKDLKNHQKELDAIFDKPIADAYRAHRSVCASKNMLVEPIMEAEKIVKKLLATYQTKIDMQAEEDRKERQRIADEQYEKERKAAAKAAEKSGDKAAAKAILNDNTPAPIVESQIVAPRVEGVSFKTEWKFQVTDFKALVRACSSGKAAINLVCPDEKALRQFASATQGNVQLPGVRIYSEKNVASKAA